MGFFFVDQDKLMDVLLIAIDISLSNIKPPGMNAELFFLEPFLNERIAFNMLDLLKDVDLRNLVMFRELRIDNKSSSDLIKGLFAIFKPRFDVGAGKCIDAIS